MSTARQEAFISRGFRSSTRFESRASGRAMTSSGWRRYLMRTDLLQTPAYATVFMNGVLVQNHFELKGETIYIGKPFYKKFDSAPIKLQAHPDPSEQVSFRNIWVRDLN